MTRLSRKTRVFGDVPAKASIGGNSGKMIRRNLVNRTSGRPFRSSQTAQTAKVPAPPGRSHIEPTMTAAIDDILKQAVLEKSMLRLTALAGSKSTHAAKALQWSEAPGPEGLWVHLPDDDEATIARFGTSLPAVSVSFAVDQTRYAFESSVLSRNRRFWLNDSVMFDALLIAAPGEVHQIQERRHPRLPVSEGSGVSGHLIRLEKPKSDVAPTANALVAIEGKLQDLSLGGAGFICSPDKALLSAPRGERLACVLDYRGTKLVLVASLARVTSVSTRAMRVGVDFTQHENEKSMTGKLAALSNVVQELERQESLRHR